MTKFTDISKRLDRAVASAVRQHRGPKLWLLNEQQLAQYQYWQVRQTEQMAQYEVEHGPGAYYGAYLNGEVEHAPLPKYLKRALQIAPSPSIPADATLAEAYQIYEDYRSQ